MKFIDQPSRTRISAQLVERPHPRSLGAYGTAGAVATILLAAPSLSSAQQARTSSATEPAAGLEVVLVTAQRRSESIQETPLAVTAVSGAELAQRNVTDVDSLQRVVPSLTYGNAWGGVNLEVRGIGNDNIAIGADAGVALHVDGIYLSSNHFAAMSLFDLERVEVLRGPQGTLYGRNATGGSINFITRDPTDEWEGEGRIVLGNYNARTLSAAAGGPMIDGLLGVRAAFQTVRHDGYTPNRATSGKDYDDEDSVAGRIKFVLTPGEAFSATLGLHFSSDRGNGPATVYGGKALPGFVTPAERYSGETFPDERGPRVVAPDEDAFLHREVRGANLRLQWDLAGARVAWNTGYWDRSFENPVDYDMTPIPGAEMRRDEEQKNFVSELSVASASEGRWNWQAGLFYFDDESYERLDALIAGLDPPVREFDYYISDGTVYSKSYAVFGEIGYRVTDRLKATVGLRYSRDEKEMDHLLDFGFGAFVATDSEVVKDDWPAWTPRFVLDYAFSDTTMAYVSVSRGFKAGGLNYSTIPASSFDPEFILNYELGLKTTLLDDRLRLNLAAFRSDYEGLQQVQVVFASTEVTNASDAEINGLEAELLFQPIAPLTIDASLVYLDATFEDFQTEDETRPQDGILNLSGNRLPRTPEWRFALGARYEMPLGSLGTGALRLDYARRSKVYFTPFNREDQAQDGYHTLDASYTIHSANDVWYLQAYGRNLTDESYRAGLLKASGALGHLNLDYYGAPRTYGVAFGFNF